MTWLLVEPAFLLARQAASTTSLVIRVEAIARVINIPTKQNKN
jgi:hypothetical protein